MEENNMTVLGSVFPEMTVATTHGQKVLPKDYSGKWIVLFSHPGDFTPVCTTEFVEFSRQAEEFKKLNTELLGLSIDQLQSHMKWTEWISENLNVEVPFPIIADEMGRVATKLGMIHPAKGTNTVRSVFIVDDKGAIRLIMNYPQEIGRDVNEILRALKALQISDKNKVALPEKWPNNFLIKDRVIVPPAANEARKEEVIKLAKDGEFEMFDWWFVHKDLDN